MATELEGTVEAREEEVADAELVGDAVLAPVAPTLGTVISDDRSPTFEAVHFRVEAGVSVAPGEFVAAEAAGADGPALVLCRVLDVHEVNPHEDALSSTVHSVIPFASQYSPEGSSTVIYRIARCEPIEEVLVRADGSLGSPRELRSLPRAGGLVLPPDAATVGAVMGFLDDPTAGIHVGQIRGTEVPAVIDPGAAQRHMLIVGGIGSGKSYTRGVLAEELHLLGAAQVNIDVNGEMIDAATELGGVNVQPGRGFTIPLSALTREDLLEAVTGVQRGTNIETLIGYSFDVLQRQQRQNRRRTFDVNDLVAEIATQAPNLNMAQANTLRPAQLRTQALDRLPYLGAQYDWVSSLGAGSFVNIDCRGQLLSDLRVITAAVARDLQNLARRRELPVFTVLSVDEFHLVAPNDDRNVSTQVLREIARIGRHYRMGLILTTQSPSDVDRSILKRLLTRFLHSIEPDQLDALRGVFSDAPAEVVRSLSKLPQGTCVLSGVAETVRHAAVIDVRRRVTTHGGATPDVWGAIRDGGWGAKRSLAEIR